MGILPGVLALLLCLGSVPPGQGVGGTRQESLLMLNKVLDAISNALKFYEEEQTKINLDALIGTRLVDGQLMVLLKQLQSRGSTSLPSDVIEKIQQLQHWAEDFTDRTIPVVARGQPRYYNRIGAILDSGLWRLDYPSRDLNLQLVTKPLYTTEAMGEKESDDCLTEFLGTGQSKGVCQVSRRCWMRMTAPGYRKYSLSHQVFYLEIGKMLGCFRGGVLPVIDQLNANYCANMYQEASEILQQGFPEERKDLFMEEAGLCGILGYRQFFTEDWVFKILSWQRPRGCYGLPRIPTRADYAFYKNGHFKKKSLGKSRSKREERLLEDGCQSHRTAVALAALTQYVRYISEYIDAISTKTQQHSV